MKNSKIIFILLTFAFSLLFGSTFIVYSKDNGQDNKPYEKLNQTIDNINSKGDQSILNAKNSLKNLDNIFNALNKYYKKQSKTSGTDGIVDSKIMEAQVKKDAAYSRINSALQAIKTFKAAQKKDIGDMNKLKNDLNNFADAFGGYKSSLSGLIDAVSTYHNRIAQASPSPQGSNGHYPQKSPGSSPAEDQEQTKE